MTEEDNNAPLEKRLQSSLKRWAKMTEGTHLSTVCARALAELDIVVATEALNSARESLNQLALEFDDQ